MYVCMYVSDFNPTGVECASYYTTETILTTSTRMLTTLNGGMAHVQLRSRNMDGGKHGDQSVSGIK